MLDIRGYAEVPVSDIRPDFAVIVLMFGYKTNPRSCPGDAPVCFWLHENGDLLEISAVDFNDWPIYPEDWDDTEFKLPFSLGIHNSLELDLDAIYESINPPQIYCPAAEFCHQTAFKNAILN